MALKIRRKRIGKTLSLSWEVLSNGEAKDLSNLNLTFYRLHMGKKEKLAFVINPNAKGVLNVIRWIWQGKDQTQLGRYCFQLYANEGETNQTICDCSTAIELVPISALES